MCYLCKINLSKVIRNALRLVSFHHWPPAAVTWVRLAGFSPGPPVVFPPQKNNFSIPIQPGNSRQEEPPCGNLLLNSHCHYFFIDISIIIIISLHVGKFASSILIDLPITLRRFCFFKFFLAFCFILFCSERERALM